MSRLSSLFAALLVLFSFMNDPLWQSSSTVGRHQAVFASRALSKQQIIANQAIDSEWLDQRMSLNATQSVRHTDENDIKDRAIKYQHSEYDLSIANSGPKVDREVVPLDEPVMARGFGSANQHSAFQHILHILGYCFLALLCGLVVIGIVMLSMRRKTKKKNRNTETTTSLDTDRRDSKKDKKGHKSKKKKKRDTKDKERALPTETQTGTSYFVPMPDDDDEATRRGAEARKRRKNERKERKEKKRRHKSRKHRAGEEDEETDALRDELSTPITGSSEQVSRQTLVRRANREKYYQQHDRPEQSSDSDSDSDSLEEMTSAGVEHESSAFVQQVAPNKPVANKSNICVYKSSVSKINQNGVYLNPLDMQGVFQEEQVLDKSQMAVKSTAKSAKSSQISPTSPPTSTVLFQSRDYQPPKKTSPLNSSGSNEPMTRKLFDKLIAKSHSSLKKVGKTSASRPNLKVAQPSSQFSWEQVNKQRQAKPKSILRKPSVTKSSDNQSAVVESD